MTDEERIVDKITKLLDLANHPKTPTHEAENAFAVAQALMTKWAIDDLALQARNGVKKHDDTLTTVTVKLASTYFAPRMYLWSGVAKANDLKVVYTSPRTGKQGAVHMSGFKSDIDRVLLLTTQLDLFMSHEASKARNPDPEVKPYYFKRSFMEGFANRITRRLLDARKLTVDTAVKDDTTNKLLPALRSKSEEVDTYFAKKYGNTLRAGRTGTHSKTSWAGHAAGKAAADRADIGQKAAGSGPRKGLHS